MVLLRCMGVFALLSLFAFPSCKADGYCPEPACDYPCRTADCGWVAGADYITRKVRRTDMDYAFTYSGGVASGTVGTVKSDYQGGIRVFGGYAFCDSTLVARVSNFSSDASSTMVDPAGGLGATQLVGAFSALTQGTDIRYAKGQYGIDNIDFDLIYTYFLGCHPCFDWGVFAGPKYMKTNQRFTFRYQDHATAPTNVDLGRTDIDIDSYGLSVGGRFEWNALSCLSFFGSLGMDLLYSYVDRDLHYQTSSDGGVNFTDKSHVKQYGWRGTTGVISQIGVAWTAPECWCMQARIHVGYEFHQWLNTPAYLFMTSGSNELSFDRHSEDFNWDGWYAGLSVAF